MSLSGVGLIAFSVCFGGRNAFIGCIAGGLGSFGAEVGDNDLVSPFEGVSSLETGVNDGSGRFSVLLLIPSGVFDLEDAALIDEPPSGCFGNGRTFDVLVGLTWP